MSDLISSVNGIFEKIAEVIDLSFFPPGAACLAAGLYWNEHAGFFAAAEGHGAGSWPGWFQAGGALLGSYALGLLCFSAGRLLRGRLFRRPSDAEELATLRGALEAHGAVPAPFDAYFTRTSARPLHARMWTEIREDGSLRESYRLLQHYWVLTATYDGMATAFVVWAAVVLHLAFRGGMPPVASAVASGIAAVACVLLMGACIRESRRLQSTQIEELAATLAHRAARPATEAKHT